MKTNNHTLFKTFLALPIMFLSLSVNALTFIDDGLSSDFSNPTVIDFEIGSNIVTFVTDTFNTGADIIQFTVEDGQSLDTAQLLSFISLNDNGTLNISNRAFFGIIDATTFTPPAPGGFPGGGDLETGLLFGSNDVGTDLFDSVDASNGAGFNNLPITELLAGEYIFWFNETAGLDIYSIDFRLSGTPDVEAVPLPAAFYLMIAPLATVLGFKRKKATV